MRFLIKFRQQNLLLVEEEVFMSFFSKMIALKFFEKIIVSKSKAARFTANGSFYICFKRRKTNLKFTLSNPFKITTFANSKNSSILNF